MSLCSYNHKGSGFAADVSYDIFLDKGTNVDCTTSAGSHDYEVMIWMAAYGQFEGNKFRPEGHKLSKPFHYKNKKGRSFDFDLFEGPHPGGWKIYSFLPANGKTYNEFDGNLAHFLKEIVQHHDKGIAEATVQSVQAGTEAVSAESATFQTHAFSISGH